MIGLLTTLDRVWEGVRVEYARERKHNNRRDYWWPCGPSDLIRRSVDLKIRSEFLNLIDYL